MRYAQCEARTNKVTKWGAFTAPPKLKTTKLNMYRATHYIITPHAGKNAYGFAFSKSPKDAVHDAIHNAYDGLNKWERKYNHCSSIGGEVTELYRNSKHILQILDL